MEGKIMATVQKGSMEANVVEEPRLGGYRFDAVGTESLPLAVDLALLQARGGMPAINRILSKGEEHG